MQIVNLNDSIPDNQEDHKRTNHLPSMLFQEIKTQLILMKVLNRAQVERPKWSSNHDVQRANENHQIGMV